MQAACQHLLTRTTLAQQHHGRIAAGHFFNGATNSQDLRVSRHQPGQGIGLVDLLQPAIFALQLKQPVGTFYSQDEQLRLKGLGKKIIGPHGNGTQRIGLVVLAGQYDHFDVRVKGENLPEQPKALRHAIGIGWQPQIHRHHSRCAFAQLHQRRFPVMGSRRIKAVKRPLDLFLQRQVILNNQQRSCLIRCHATSRV